MAPTSPVSRRRRRSTRRATSSSSTPRTCTRPSGGSAARPRPRPTAPSLPSSSSTARSTASRPLSCSCATPSASSPAALCFPAALPLLTFARRPRALRSFMLLPGVNIGDLGKKMGRDGIDNGFIQFTYVRVPRSHMLMKHTQCVARLPVLPSRHLIPRLSAYPPGSRARARFSSRLWLSSRTAP
jgi:hypothetical protein